MLEYQRYMACFLKMNILINDLLRMGTGSPLSSYDIQPLMPICDYIYNRRISETSIGTRRRVSLGTIQMTDKPNTWTKGIMPKNESFTEYEREMI